KKSYSPPELFLFAILYPFSIVYGLVVAARIHLYTLGVLKSLHPGMKVVSIGNITTGGTGKTPFVSELAQYLSMIPGNNVAVISRGYGKIDPDAITVVKDNNMILVESYKIAGDEPYMLAQFLKNVTIITGSKRVAAAKLAINKYHCNILILDDGFQHLKIKRDYNIVLIDAENQFGNNKLLPLGPLREPLKSISRADAIIYVDKNKYLKNIPENNFINKLNKPVFIAQFEAEGFINIKDNSFIKDINDTSIIAISGIAQPESFYKILETKQLTPVKTISFTDHKDYSNEDIDLIIKNINDLKSDALVTTQKDAVKLLSYINRFDCQVYAIKMKMQIDIKKILEKINFYE
ncbi:MAG: tetraacyldisaccharide 4'-kinase, partial [Cyanobacteriota bacterium]